VNRIKLLVNVPLAAAVARGSAAYGDAVVELSDADVAGLGVQARKELALARPNDAGVLVAARVSDSYYAAHSLTVDVADVAHVVAALDDRAAARAELVARPAREREARIQAALAKPDDEWISDSAGYEKDEYYIVDDTGKYAETSGRYVRRPRVEPPVRGDDRADPRIIERVQLVHTWTLSSLVTRWDARKLEWDAYVDQKRRERKAASDAYQAAIRDVASREDDLARAASDGYDVERAVLDRLAEKLVADVGNARRRSSVTIGGISAALSVGEVYAEIDTMCWKSPADRAAPSPDAFALLDRVTAACKRANGELPAAIGQWEVSRIVRVDTCHSERREHWVTAVLATLATLGPRSSERQITFSLESQDCEDEDE
jgi:hypothetical protein